MFILSSSEFVFFDVANTLLGKRGQYDAIQSAIRRHFGKNIHIDSIIRNHTLLSELSDFPNETSREFYIKFNNKLLEMCGLPQCDVAAQEIFTVVREIPWQPFDDVATLAHSKLPMGIISNWDETLVGKLSRMVPVRFHPVIGSQEIGFKKPDPRIFETALEIARIPADQAVYVGDSPKLDTVPARRLGIRAILLDRNRVYADYPYEKVASLRELRW